MKFTLPKNRITPIILFAIISIIVSLILGLYQMNRITHYSYKDKLKAYDSLTDNTVFVIRQGLENTYQSLKRSTDLIAKTGELDKENIEGLLPIIDKDQTYLNLSIVDAEGLGYDLEGNYVNVSAQSYFIKACRGDISVSENITYTAKNEPVIIIATPIVNNGKVKGVLIADISAQIDNMIPYESKLDQGSLIYILNVNNEILFCMQKTDYDKFDYNSIATNGFFRYEAEKMPFANIKNFYMKENGKDISYIWDKKQLGMNNWSVLIGRVNNISPFSKGILQLTNMLWILMSIGMFLLFLLIIVIQRRSNHKVIKMLYLDPVTGGDNWYGFRNIVHKILSGRQSGKKKYALINFDINRFKLINDAYGYQKGDEVLKEIYQVISRWSRQGEPFTRYAADQFYILLSFQEESEISERIHELNERLHQLHFVSTAKINYGVYIITEQLDSVDRMDNLQVFLKRTIETTRKVLFRFLMI